ncbi:mitochondrial carrier [Rickenella mellea]|uniref:Mitochondrial carrier n=1 Tax=Rickenella mellea TaxID=50990 RepID=A0A4Y7PZ32_9AGAM|nr:mitochondrial carrier [Rickenella mellea]
MSSQNDSGGARKFALISAGASFSNMVASAVTNPLDVIKVRQQLQTQAPGGTANAFWTHARRMVHTEGAMSLTNGLVPSMWREIVYSGLRLGAYEFFKDSLHSASKGTLRQDGLSLKVISASLAAALGSGIANPTDLVKVRMQAHYPDGSPYRSARHALMSVYREGGGNFKGGLVSMYRGVDATIARGLAFSVSQVVSYDQIKYSIKSRELMQEGTGLHIVASSIAGLICSIASNPVGEFNVVKVRLMNDKNRQIRGISDCVRIILRQEGVMGFYKGFGMCWARLGMHTIITFIVFERFRSLVGITPM